MRIVVVTEKEENFEGRLHRAAEEALVVMDVYPPPPTATIQLATYLEAKHTKSKITVIDCQAEELEWKELERTLEAEEPNIVAVSRAKFKRRT